MMTGVNTPSGRFDCGGPEPTNTAELAALYLSGAMTPAERDDFESRLASGNAACVTEMQRLQAAAEALLQDIAPVAPPAELHQRLLRAVEEQERAAAILGRPLAAPASTTHDERQIWRQWASDADHPLFTLRADEGGWEDTGVTGVQVRRLFVDRPANRMTAMFRMQPGTEYPEHVHDGPEECYLLDGDLHVGDELIMRRGDYQRALPGSEHGRQWTEGGCLLLVTCSLTDEMV